MNQEHGHCRGAPKNIIQQVLADENLFGGIRRLDIDLAHVRGHRDGFRAGRQPDELQMHRQRLAIRNGDRLARIGKARRRPHQFVLSRGKGRESKPALGVATDLLSSGAAGFGGYPGVRNRFPLRVRQLPVHTATGGAEARASHHKHGGEGTRGNKCRATKLHIVILTSVARVFKRCYEAECGGER